MNPTPYPELNFVLQDLVASLQQILGEIFIGAYLQGSFAVGDFDQHSDVDFIVVLNTQLSDEQVDALQIMHEQIYHHRTRWARHLEGSYFPKEVLRNGTGLGQKLWYLDNGSRSLEKSTHCNTLLVRWVVREQGVVLSGPSPKTLVDPIPAADLREEMRAVITDWGQEILDHPDRYNNRFYQAFIVLSYCRMLHDLINGFPGSKLAGAEWAKTNLAPSWIDLINGTWTGRPNPGISVRQPADPDDFERTLAFVSYVIEQSKLV